MVKIADLHSSIIKTRPPGALEQSPPPVEEELPDKARNAIARVAAHRPLEVDGFPKRIRKRASGACWYYWAYQSRPSPLPQSEDGGSAGSYVGQ